MYAASREALATTRAALDEALRGDDDGSVSAAVGAELFVVVDYLAAERSLRGLLADPAADVDAKRRLADTVFGSRVSAATAGIVREAVGLRWSSGGDLVRALEELGRQAWLASAERRDLLATVEDELFRIGRIVSGSAELEIALSDRTATADRKRSLVSSLLHGKATAVTEALVSQAVGRLVGPPALTLDSLSGLAASRRRQTVAHVRCSAPMSDEQQRRLVETLTRLYGREIAAHVEVDRDLLSGLVVRVGDEIIDGSGAGRLAAVRKAIG